MIFQSGSCYKYLSHFLPICCSSLFRNLIDVVFGFVHAISEVLTTIGIDPFGIGVLVATGDRNDVVANFFINPKAG